jgi:response regulator of citrate/malate metabolism
MRIAIVEDSKLISQRVVSLISEIKGVHSFCVAENLQSARKEIPGFHPDACILDIRLPDGIGLDLLEELKAYEHPPIVIVFTNYGEMREKCMKMGVHHFLEKSKDFLKLKDILVRTEAF